MSHNSNDDQPSDPADLDQIIAEYLRTEESGGVPDRAQLLRDHPELASDLQEFFAHRDRIEKLVRPLRDALNVRCPHCHNAIEIVDESPLTEISCPSCGSQFSLVGDETASRYAPGRTIAHFELLDRVGIGAFGAVWKARDTTLDRIVAVKIPRGGQLDSSQTEMFFRDARAAAQLTHPNIVSVHEVGKHDEVLYIVSDFVNGATLNEWHAAHALTAREAAQVCLEVANALHHAHESGVIHRDLKPGNIMMDERGEPHIVDFGLAKRETGEITMTVEGQILGTPAYMSPEQARGEAHLVDRRADNYSLGVILFELITGELPFRGDKQMLIVQILNDDPPRLRMLCSGVPRDLETICLKCLEKDPHRRYATAKDVADDIGRFLVGEAIRARPIGRISHVARWCGRNPILASLAAVITILLCSVSVVSVLGYRELLGELDAIEEKELSDRRERDAKLDTRVEQAKRLLADKRPDFARAIHLLDDVLEYRPDDAVLYRMRGGARFELGLYDPAVNDLERALKLEEDNDLDTRFLLALACQRIGRFKQSNEIRLRVASENSSLSLLLGSGATQDPRATWRLIRDAIPAELDNSVVALAVARRSLRLLPYTSSLEHYEWTLSALRRAAERRPWDPEPRLLQCECLIRNASLSRDLSQSSRDARTMLDALIAADTAASERARHLKDELNFLSGRLDDAEAAAKQLSTEGIAGVDVSLLRGALAFEREQYDEAVDWFERARHQIDATSNLPGRDARLKEVRNRIARCQLTSGDGAVRRQATDDIRAATALPPDFVWPRSSWATLIEACLAAELHAEALNVCDKWLLQAPDCGEAYAMRGMAKAALERHSDAVDDFAAALRLAPSQDVHQAMAVSAEASGQIALAESHWEQAIARHPADAASGVRLGRLLVAKPTRDPTDLIRAAAAYAASLQQSPENADWWSYLGDCELHRSRFDEARNAYEKSLALESDLLRSRLGLAKSLWFLGQHARCLAQFERALRGQVEPVRKDILREIVALPAADSASGKAVGDFVTKQLSEASGADSASIRGAAHYRAGDWEAALDELRSADLAADFKTLAPPRGGDGGKITSDWRRLGFNWLFLAMANWRSGNQVKATSFLDQATTAVDTQLARDDTLAMLRREAVKLIASEGRWSQWRGSRGDGVSEVGNLPTNWTKDKNVAWRLPLPAPAVSTPVVWGDFVFLTSPSTDGSELLLLCIHRSGEVRWIETVCGDRENNTGSRSNGAKPSPCTDGVYVWVLMATGDLACFNYDGELKWTRNVIRDFELPLDAMYRICSSPALEGDHIYLQLIHRDKQADANCDVVMALDKSTGSEAWRVDRSLREGSDFNSSYSSPLVYRDPRRQFLLAHGAGLLTAHRLEDGKELWRFNFPSFSKYLQMASPVAANGAIIVPMRSGSASPRLSHVFAFEPDGVGDISESRETVLWERKSVGPDVASPLIYRGLVFFPAVRGEELYCFDARTGATVGSRRMDQCHASPVIADGKIYYTSKKGKVIVMEAGPTMEVIAENDIEENIESSPAVARNRIYLRTHEALWAIEKDGQAN